MKPKKKLPKADLTGRVFGRLTVISYQPSTRWVCRCECGNITVAMTSTLNNGLKRSCGCLVIDTLRKNATKHGGASGRKSPTWKTWYEMIRRCRSKTRKCYKHYGGRGIKVCDRWKDYGNFKDDMGEKPIGMTLGRIDNNGDYEPTNCRWETIDEQSNNKRTSRFLEIDGERRTISQWARAYGLDPQVAFSRLQQGWDTMRAVTTPLNHSLSVAMRESYRKAPTI